MTTTFVFFVVAVSSLLAASCMSVALFLVIGLEHNGFFCCHFDVCRLLASERRCDVSYLGFWHCFRERNFKHNVQIAKLVGRSVEWQTFLRHRLDVVGFDNLARCVLNSEFCAIQVRYDKVNTCQSLEQRNFFLDKQVGTLALKHLVRLLLDNYDDVASLDTRELVGFAVECILLAVRCAFVNFRVDNFFFFYYFLAIAGLALVFVVNDFAFASAVVAGTLGLRVHAWSELLHARYNAAAFTCGALLDSAFFAADTLARCANTFAIDSDLGCFAIVDLF